MNTITYEGRRHQFLKCESELDAILVLVASKQGDIESQLIRLNQAKEAALETYQAYRDERNVLTSGLIDESSDFKKVASLAADAVVRPNWTLSTSVGHGSNR